MTVFLTRREYLMCPVLMREQIIHFFELHLILLAYIHDCDLLYRLSTFIDVRDYIWFIWFRWIHYYRQVFHVIFGG